MIVDLSIILLDSFRHKLLSNHLHCLHICIIYCALKNEVRFLFVYVLSQLTSSDVPFAYHPYPSKRTEVTVLQWQYTRTREGMDKPEYIVLLRFHVYTTIESSLLVH